MILSDATILTHLRDGYIGCTPWDASHVQPASLEVHLAWTGDDEADPEGDGLLLLPGDFILAHTIETVRLPPGIGAQLSGKSSLGRLGLQVHATAGWIDPGFEGQIVFELKNLNITKSIYLEYGQAIAQLVFHLLDQPAKHPYGHPQNNNHYQHQRGTRYSYLDNSRPRDYVYLRQQPD